MANPSNMILDSDYPMDKIAYFKQGTFDPSVTEILIPHNLGFAPLCFGVFSPDEDFSTPYSFSTPLDILYDQTYKIFVEVSSFLLSYDDHISLVNSYLTGYVQSPCYYRIYGFAPSSISPDVDFTNIDAYKLLLSSDYNYSKLYMEGESTSSTSIMHNLGYRPQVLAWMKRRFLAGRPIEIINTFSKDYEGIITGVRVTNNAMTIDFSDGWEKVFWRIYLDES